MIARGSADMVDLSLFSLGPAEALVRMISQSELTLPTAHTVLYLDVREKKQRKSKNQIKMEKCHRPHWSS